MNVPRPRAAAGGNLPLWESGCDDSAVKHHALEHAALLGRRPRRIPAAHALGAWVLCLAVGCGGASVQAEGRVGGDVQTFDFDQPLAEEELADEPRALESERARASFAQSEAAEARPGGAYALLGARRDLSLSPDVRGARCQCLGVVLGPPDTKGMVWRGPAPSVHPTRQTVIALSSEGVECSGNAGEQIASYRGYSVEGGDVIVTVEIARAGRPVTQGAILPVPDGAGQIYVRPRNAEVPFGRGLDGAPRCALGSPGATASPGASGSLEDR